MSMCFLRTVFEGGLTGSMDIVLVIANLIGPRPLLQIGGRAHLVEASIPQNCA
jgi:hypothetical protein